MAITGFIADAREDIQGDNENEKIPKKIEPTLEQSSPLHSLQVFFFYFSIFTKLQFTCIIYYQFNTYYS